MPNYFSEKKRKKELPVLFFRRRELFYADHLVFALHFHAFVFFLFTLYLIITEIFPAYKIGIYFFLYIPLIYFVWAIWVVYRPKIKTLLFKIGAIFIFYGITVIASMVALIFILAGLGEMIDIMKEAVT